MYGGTILKHRKNFFKKWLLPLILFSVSLGGLFFYIDVYREKTLPIDLHGIVDDPQALEGWTAFTPKDRQFSIFFPSTPAKKTRTLPVPGDLQPLPYREFYFDHTDNQTLFSVSYTTLPDRWLRFGSGLVLKGAHKILLRELGKISIVGKSSNTFKSYPALDYEYYSEQTETTGTLILVGNILYKVEITYPLKKRLDAQRIAAPFIQSFQPNASASTDAQKDETIPDPTTFPDTTGDPA